MNRVLGPSSRSPFSVPSDMSSKTRTVPVLTSSIAPSENQHGDAMDVTPPSSASMGPPVQSSPEVDHGGAHNATNGTGQADAGGSQNSSQNQPVGAAAAAQQPKVVQTAFIHKLYNMLQDPSIQHLISWSSSNESFVMSPSSEFSKVLAQYFKHTNVSSFVRQLNMYGFHKVSDVFHTGSPDSPMWEFKHGNGNFRKGDVAGLREIKRRASRHALIHRDSFPGHKPNPSQPGTPAEAVPDGPDARLMGLEHTMYDIHNRLARMEDSNALLSARCQALTESLVRCHQWTNSMSHFIMSLVPDPDNAVHRDVANMQREVARQLDVVRALENPHEALMSGRQPPYFGNMSIDPGPPLSPRQFPQDDSRRSSIARPAIPPHLSVSPRRYGSVGTANQPPSYSRPQAPAQPPAPHPLSSVSSPPGPNLARRHTSADIREHGWPATGPNPFAPGNAQPQWPPSPNRPTNPGDQQVREVLAQYQMGGPRRQPDIARHATPPIPPEPAHQMLNPESGWSIGGPKFHRHPESLPATRRSSMASNVHSLLNPADTAERADEDEGPMGEDRNKRKRLQ